MSDEVLRRKIFQKRVTETVEQQSLHVLQSFVRDDTFRVSPVKTGEDFSYDHWICSIMVPGPGRRFVFRMHFTSADARLLAAKGLGKNPAEISPILIQDFIREYVNRVMGAIKPLVRGGSAENHDPVGAAIVPHVEPSYDLAQLKNDNNGALRSWRLSSAGGCWACQAMLELEEGWDRDQKSTEDITVVSVSDAGSVEFL